MGRSRSTRRTDISSIDLHRQTRISTRDLHPGVVESIDGDDIAWRLSPITQRISQNRVDSTRFPPSMASIHPLQLSRPTIAPTFLPSRFASHFYTSQFQEICMQIRAIIPAAITAMARQRNCMSLVHHTLSLRCRNENRRSTRHHPPSGRCICIYIYIYIYIYIHTSSCFSSDRRRWCCDEE